ASDNHRERRRDPSRLGPGIRAVVCGAMCHPPTRDAARDERLGRIARYAAGEDYHAIMRDRLLALERWIQNDLLPGSGSLWYADTGAILERGWAERAGIGWVGKHSGVLSDSIGSWFLLGEVLVDRELVPDAPVRERCGTCPRCLDVCPTRAIVAPYRVDARLCISYLTIETRGPIPHELRPAIGDWIFGCDLCQEVCPWNRFAPEAREARLQARDLPGWDLVRFLSITEDEFRTLFATSPIRRADRAGFLRNVCVAMGNRAEARFIAPLMHTLAHDPEALGRGHAGWALGQLALAHASEVAAIRAALDLARVDADAFVCEEATRALESCALLATSASTIASDTTRGCTRTTPARVCLLRTRTHRRRRARVRVLR
ncbi:MAG: tRNA epoxyqueuosine(34) reductase QueG, partial [bacterium]